MKDKKTSEDYHDLAKARGFKWLRRQAHGTTKEKTKWQCSKGHRWQTTFSLLHNRKTGCPQCYFLSLRKTPADYHRLAKLLGLHWLGPEVSNAETKTNWRCHNGHQWVMTYHALQQGVGCPECRRQALRLSPRDYRALARMRGIKWLGKASPTNYRIKTQWQCPKGHRWFTSYTALRVRVDTNTCGCPVCNKRTPEDYHTLAKSCGFKWIGPKVANTAIKTVWECSQGHRWRQTYWRLKGCPVCARTGHRKNILTNFDQEEESHHDQKTHPPLHRV